MASTILPRIRARLAEPIVATVLAAAALGGCERLLEVELPTRVPASTLRDPALANVLVLGAVGDFECAFVNYVAATGLLVDELIASATWAAVVAWDQRRIFPITGNLTASCTAQGYGVFTPLQTARFQAEDAFEILDSFSEADVPRKIELMATVSAYAAYTYTLLGEGFCEVTVAEGPILTPPQVFALAEERFTTAIDLAGRAGQTELLTMAYAGRARVRRNLDRLAEAAEDARRVPEDFVFHATYSAAAERRWNRVYVDQYRDFYLSVHPSFRHLEWAGVPDPRVKVFFAGRRGMDQVTDVWLQTKYSNYSSPLRIASWAEAQLIIAEAAGGQAAVDAINRLHARAKLPPFASTNPAEIRSQIIEERRRELFLEGHRLHDMLRYDLPFDSGVDHKGVPYGETTCLPLPQVERDHNQTLRGR